MRTANSNLPTLIKEDQAANTELIPELTRLLNIPAVLHGGTNRAIFKSFCETMEVGGKRTHTVSFGNHMVS